MVRNDHQFSCEVRPITTTGLKPSFPSVCFWSQKYKNSEKFQKSRKVVRNPFGLGRGHLSPTCVSDCLSVSEGHNSAMASPSSWKFGDKLQRDNLKPRSSAIAQAGLATGSCGSWKRSMAKVWQSHQQNLVLGMTSHTLICALQQFSFQSWPKCFFIFSPVTI